MGQQQVVNETHGVMVVHMKYQKTKENKKCVKNGLDGWGIHDAIP